MEKDFRSNLMVNEVIVVGAKRAGKTEPLPEDATNEQIRDLYTFLKDTQPDEAARAANFTSNKWLQLRMCDPGGETITKGNKTLKVSRATNSYAYRNIFKAQHGITYDEIVEEILANRFALVKGSNQKNTITGVEEAQIRLTEYGLVGFWDVFDVGFKYTVHTRGENGIPKPMISNTRNTITGKFEKAPATSFSARNFILQSEIENVEGIRKQIKARLEGYKILNTSSDTPEVETEIISGTAKKGTDEDV